jgi:hypothetical protein
MKKFPLKFILFTILSLFSSFVYADGVFSKYNNEVFLFSINVPIIQYKVGTGEIVNLDFVRNSNSIPTKDFFSAFEAENGDGLTIKDKSESITILAYGANYLNIEEAEGLQDMEYMKSSFRIDYVKSVFKKDKLDYNKFVKKYYNGKLPKNIDPLIYDYNKNLFIYGENVAYNTIGKNFYVVSYIEENKIVYKKVIYSKDSNAYIVFQASYLPKDKKFMDKLVVEMVNSIRY